ncbi:MAG: helix-turn-helix domain-containing protein [Desulfovibrio sp.]|nr:helix-turn-helix domain-containing protein [Desulfovibrio sp.]
MSESFYPTVMGLLDKAIEKHGSAKELAKAAGVNAPNISRWKNGKQEPRVKDIGAIMDLIGVRVAPPPATMHRMGANSPVEKVEGSSLPRVPVLGTAGAGAPQEFWNSEPEMMIEVLPQYFRPDMVTLRVDGDSMEPTIQKGAYVGVVKVAGDIEEGGVYLVHIPPFGRVVKRVRAGQGDTIELVSDNAKYPPKAIPLEQYDQIIIGRVAWVWQSM